MKPDHLREELQQLGTAILTSPPPSGEALRARARRSRLTQVLSWAVAAAVVALIIVTTSTLLSNDRDSEDVVAGQQEVAVPSLVGLGEHDAIARLHALNLDVGEVKHATADDIELGTVVGQAPEPGTVVDQGTLVSISVADKKPQREVNYLTIQNERSTTVIVEVARPPASATHIVIDPGDSATLDDSKTCSYAWLRATTADGRMIDKYNQPCQGQTWQLTDARPGICARLEWSGRIYVPAADQPDVGVGQPLGSASGTNCDSSEARRLKVFGANEEPATDALVVSYDGTVVLYRPERAVGR